MLIGIYQSAAILALVITFYTIDFLLIARYDKQRQAEGSGRSWGYTIMVTSMAVFVIVQPITWPWLGIHTEAWWGTLIQAIGLMLIIGGLVTQTWSRVHLRQFYAERVEIQPEHFVVSSGPYAYVRHPFFISLFILVVGLMLINPALPTLLLAVYAFGDFSRAAKQEEALLNEHLPGYAEYMVRTPRFFPRFCRQLGNR